MSARTDEVVLVAARRHRLLTALTGDEPQPARTARQLLLDDLLLERYAPGPRPLSTATARLSTTRPQTRTRPGPP